MWNCNVCSRFTSFTRFWFRGFHHRLLGFHKCISEFGCVKSPVKRPIGVVPKKVSKLHNRKDFFFYGHNFEDRFVGAPVVKKSTEKGVEKSRLQGFPVGPMENPIDYTVVSMGNFRPITKWVKSGVNRKGDKFALGEPKFWGPNRIGLRNMTIFSTRLKLTNDVTHWKFAFSEAHFSRTMAGEKLP